MGLSTYMCCLCLCCIVGILLVIFLGIWLIFFRLDESPQSTVAKQKCEEYAKLACSYPNPSGDSTFGNSSRFERGIKATKGQFPHMVFIIMATPNSDRHQICGATLISEFFALTAAHCVHGFQRGEIRYTLGDVDYAKVIDDSNLNDVVQIIIHAKYDSNSDGKAYDIALLRLGKMVELDWNKRPICLNTDFHSIRADDEQFTTCGWGTDDETGNHTIASLKVLDQYLNASDGSLADCIHEVSGKHIICATNPHLTKSGCPGVSGGPLQIPLKKDTVCGNTYEQVGIVHTLAPICARLAGTGSREKQFGEYTRVDEYIDWIVPQVWPEFYEKSVPDNYIYVNKKRD